MSKDKKKYIAIKVNGLDHWLWFERAETSEKDGRFKGTNGWGEGGASTSIDVSSDEITGRIESDELQYSN